MAYVVGTRIFCAACMPQSAIVLEGYDQPAFCSTCNVFLQNPLSKQGRDALIRGLKDGTWKGDIARELSDFYDIKLIRCASCRVFRKPTSLVCSVNRCLYRNSVLCENCVITCQCGKHICVSHSSGDCVEECPAALQRSCYECGMIHREKCLPFIRQANRARRPQDGAPVPFRFSSDVEE